MPFFLDYEAEGLVRGHVRIPRVTCEEAALYAREALRGLRCLRATVRCGATLRSAAADCRVIARYTRQGGWTILNGW